MKTQTDRTIDASPGARPAVIPRHVRFATIAGAALALFVMPVSADEDLEFFANPPAALLSQPGDADPAALVAAPARTVGVASLTANRGEVAWEATIAYTQGRIFNPRMQRYDTVRLRSYQGEGVDPRVPFVAPTVNLRPGETFRLTLNNALPKDDPSCPGTGNPNDPHCFNSTNMHTHGLWISPTGNSDNVLLRINPGVSFTYEYNTPADHPAGTFWYHPHLHGSTALQVSSGMAGALIIHGDRLPSPEQTGDVDTLLRNVDGSPYPERIVLIQQIPYACRDADGNIKKDANGQWICDPTDVGTVEGYDQFGPTAWSSSGRYTSVNGRVAPVFADATAGQIERWRLIHAGVRDSVHLRFQKLRAEAAVVASARGYDAITAEDQQAFVDTNCGGAPAAQLSLAMDGLPREMLVQQEESVLHPGYREDLLMVFPESGIYCIIDDAAPGNETVNSQIKGRELLGFVNVGRGRGTGGLDPETYIKQQLIAAAARFMPPNVRAGIIADLDSRLGLAAFQPHAPIPADEVTGEQTLSFNIQLPDGTRPLEFQVGQLDGNGDPIDLAPYDPDRIDRNLMLGGVDEWTLKSFRAGHPFHIHVNPFQIVSVLDADGRDVSGFEPGNDSQYARLKGVWKDTLFVTQDDDNRPYTIVARTRYERYIGDFVLHCHILDHEDQGMMQNVRISLPDGEGGLALAHH